METEKIKMTIQHTIKRLYAGEYAVTSLDRPDRTVAITKVYYPNDGIYWVTIPDFDNNTGDPLFTKRDAVESAIYMLETY